MPRKKKSEELTEEVVAAEEVTEETTTEETKKVDVTTLSPKEYFDYVKGMKETTNSEYVKKAYDICKQMIEKFEKLGQVPAATKAKLHMEVLRRELELLDLGYDIYVNAENVRNFIENVSGRCIKIIAIEDYPREIPDDVADKWLAIKDKFDKGYIVFTDYTGEAEKQVEKTRKEKDPILFGALKVDSSRKSMAGNMYEKLFCIADWVDEYCDLTFEKLVGKMVIETGVNPVVRVTPVETKEDFSKGMNA